MYKIKLFIPILLIGVIIVSGCTSNKVTANLPETATAKDVIPQSISEYNKVDTNSLIAEAVGAVAGVTVGVLSEGNVALAYGSSKIANSITRCYQRAGAMDSSGFYKSDDPRYGGFVGAIDRNQMTDPNLFLSCLTKALFPFSMVGKEFNPCSVRFTIETDDNDDDNEFYVVMTGTDTSVCRTFCDNMRDSDNKIMCPGY